jgi:ABC-type hemin transport system substrate-binding protein
MMPQINDKIWSLLPSATEIVFALGHDDRLVGVTHECDFPPAVRGLVPEAAIFRTRRTVRVPQELPRV